MKKTIAIMLFILCFSWLQAKEHKDIIVIPVEINEVSFTSTAEDFQAILDRCNLYLKQLDGHYPDSLVLGPTIRLTSGRYNTNTAYAAATEAFRICTSMMDVSKFSNNVGIIFSGDLIWPHENNTQSGARQFFMMSEYFQEERLEAGIICHEYGHILGLRDLYDGDGNASGGLSKGLHGNLSLMDEGDRLDGMRTPASLSSIDLYQLGIGQCDTLKPGNYTLQPLTREKRYLYLPTDTAKEFFLLECRAAESWDEFIGGEGLVIYHIDQSNNKAGHSTYYNSVLTASRRWEYNEVNCRPDRMCAYVVEALPDAENIADIFFPYTESQTISAESAPSLRYWSGKGSPLAITDITRNSNKSVSFKVIEPIKTTRTIELQTAVIICWQIDRSLSGVLSGCEVELTSASESISLTKIMPDSKGEILFRADNLQADNEYDAELTIHCDDADYSISNSFKTKIKDERNDIPFIYMGMAQKNPSGFFERGSTFPLYVYNGHKAVSIRWFFDGTEIKESLFTVSQSGILRAVLEYEDGSQEIICKEIQVR